MTKDQHHPKAEFVSPASQMKKIKSPQNVPKMVCMKQLIKKYLRQTGWIDYNSDRWIDYNSDHTRHFEKKMNKIQQKLHLL